MKAENWKQSKLNNNLNINREFKFATNAKYYVGRKTENDLYLNGDGISRGQFTIYIENEKWLLKDGDGDEKRSSNGTW